MLTSVDRLLFVRRVPIFKELRDDFIVRLTSVMNELSFPANYTIFRQGEEGRSLYIVVSGRVKVHIGNKQLAEVDQGKYFGEMAVFDTQTRSATATTLEACEFLELTQDQLYDAIEETPEIAVNIIRELSRLIRKLNDDMNMTASGRQNNS
jgi:CRP-like cAMP-binding protein